MYQSAVYQSNVMAKNRDPKSSSLELTTGSAFSSSIYPWANNLSFKTSGSLLYNENNRVPMTIWMMQVKELAWSLTQGKLFLLPHFNCPSVLSHGSQSLGFLFYGTAASNQVHSTQRRVC